jgi:hypothetical protein
MTIEAMKQALEALENASPDQYPEGARVFYDAKDALRQAIEQAEKQEPVAWDVFNKHGRIYFSIGNQSFPVEYTPEDEPDCSAGQAAEWYMDQLRHALTRLATAPPQRTWVGLTDEEIAEGIKQSWVTEQAFQSAAWWAEERLKEKNK